MELAERNRLIAVTKGFQCLQQGLCWAPMGVLNVAVAWIVNPEISLAQLGVVLAVMLCAIAASFASGWYYRRRFGVVRGRADLKSVLLVTLGTIVGLVTLVGAGYVDGAFYKHPAWSGSVSLTCLWWAVFYLVLYFVPYGIRPHSLWFTALFLALGFLTFSGVAAKNQFFWGYRRPGNLLIWVAFSVHGLLDHLRLLRLMPKASPNQATPQAASQPGERHA